MQILKIDPISLGSFYVIANDGQDITNLSKDPICFSPISYSIEQVEIGDIPAMAKIVTINPLTQRADRLTLQNAVKMVNNCNFDFTSDIEAAVSNLREVMIRNGMRSPIRIELESADDAHKIIEYYRPMFTADGANLAIKQILADNSFMIHGVKFTWPSERVSSEPGNTQSIVKNFFTKTREILSIIFQ